MTTVQTPSTTPPSTAARWWPAAALAATGPVAVAILRGILPYDTPDDAATVATKVAAHPGAQSAVLGLTYLTLLTLPLGVVLVGRVAVRARPVLGAVAAGVAWLGFMSLFASVGYDTISFAGTRAGLPVPTVAALGAALDASPVTAVPPVVFVAGHILGVVLLAVALWRVMPRWAAVALAVSQPLHLVFAVFVPNHVLDALAWTLTGVGFAAAVVVGGRRSAR